MPKYKFIIGVEAQPKDINSWNDIARAAVSNLAGGKNTYAPQFGSDSNHVGRLISTIAVDSDNIITLGQLQAELERLAPTKSQDPRCIRQISSI